MTAQLEMPIGWRLHLHEIILRDLREDKYVEAVLGLRHLLMRLPPDHEARPDLLHILAYAERRVAKKGAES